MIIQDIYDKLRCIMLLNPSIVNDRNCSHLFYNLETNQFFHKNGDSRHGITDYIMNIENGAIVYHKFIVSNLSNPSAYIVKSYQSLDTMETLKFTYVSIEESINKFNTIIVPHPTNNVTVDKFPESMIHSLYCQTKKIFQGGTYE